MASCRGAGLGKGSSSLITPRASNCQTQGNKVTCTSKCIMPSISRRAEMTLMLPIEMVKINKQNMSLNQDM